MVVGSLKQRLVRLRFVEILISVKTRAAYLDTLLVQVSGPTMNRHYLPKQFLC